MSKIRLYGDTSGYVELQAPDVSGDVTITLPNVSEPFATEGYVDGSVAGLATEDFVGSAIAAIPGIGSNVVQTVKTDGMFISGAVAWTDVTGLSVTITPSSASSRVLLMMALQHGMHDNTRFDLSPSAIAIRITGGNALDYRGDADGSRERAINGSNYFHNVYNPRSQILSVSGTYLDFPNTSSAITYQVQVRNQNNNGVFINRTGHDSDGASTSRSASTLIAIEVGG